MRTDVGTSLRHIRTFKTAQEVEQYRQADIRKPRHLRPNGGSQRAALNRMRAKWDQARVKPPSEKVPPAFGNDSD